MAKLLPEVLQAATNFQGNYGVATDPKLEIRLRDGRRELSSNAQTYDLITLEPPPPDSDADVFMRIRNPDGSEAGACGNATRCVAALLAQETGRQRFVIRTISGDLHAQTLIDDLVAVDMGPARFEWQDVPLARPGNTLYLDLAAGPVAMAELPRRIPFGFHGNWAQGV